MRRLLILCGICSACLTGCNAFSSSSIGDDLGEWRQRWEAVNQIKESSTELKSLPTLVQSAIDELDTVSQSTPPETFLVFRQATFLAYRVLFADGTEYHFDVEGNEIEKPVRYSPTHGGVI